MSNLECISEFYAHHPDLRIGAMIRDEVVPYMRSLAVLPTPMKSEALSRVEAESTPTFLRNLERTWREHNELALEIDLFLKGAAIWQSLEIQESDLDNAVALFERAVLVEDEKRIYSASVKEALNKAMAQARIKYSFNQEDMNSIFGLWGEAPYWIYRDGAHACWLLAQRGVMAFGPTETPPLTAQLCTTFHGGSEMVLRERLNDSWLKKLVNMSTTSLLEVVNHWNEYVTSGKSRRIKAGYLTLERPELKASQTLIRYDNLIELLFGENLWGVPDLFLRRMTVNTLVRLGYADARESVLMYTVDELKNRNRLGNQVLYLRR